MNQLFYGDNLDVLRRHVADESVDLIYLDPPFNSKQNYNVLFQEQDGSRAAAQIKAFGDTWRWDQGAEAACLEMIEAGGSVSVTIQALRQVLGSNDLMAYIAMMAPRLIELRRVLKRTGSIFLHCDPTASHYLKLLMDAIFAPINFRNEIIWKRVHTIKGNAGQGSKFFGPNTDTILFYARSDDSKFTPPFSAYSDDYLTQFYRYTEPDGRRYRLISMIGPGGASKGNPHYEFLGVTRYWRYSQKRMQSLQESGMIVQSKAGTVPQRKQYLDQGKGVAVQSLWDDVPALSASSSERLGYPTQKPESLLDRIIQCGSQKGDTILDPFCGCGTATASAQRLERRWIGIDITHLAITLIKHRLKDAFGEAIAKTYTVIGEPTSLPDAQDLADSDPYQFQWWALGLVGARPVEQKKGADKGIDGRIYFHEGDAKTKQIIFSVKAGNTGAAHVRDLRGVVEREKAAIGVLIAMHKITKPMHTEAVEAGFYESTWGHKKHPRIQIFTIEELLDGRTIDAPPMSKVVTFKKAPKARKENKKSHRQAGLEEFSED